MSPSVNPPQSVPPRQVFVALRFGWQTYRRSLVLSTAYGGLFALVGLVMIWGVVELGAAPMVLPLIGGFLLLGPVALAGFFGIVRALEQARRPVPGDILSGFGSASPGLWVLSLLCLFIFLIWLTDAGTLYSFMIGERSSGWSDLLPVSAMAMRFQLSAAMIGAALAFVVYCVTAYAVPLLIERKAKLIEAVSASVKTVMRNFLVNLLWSATLAVSIGFAIVIPVLLPVVFPVLAFSGLALYRASFAPSVDEPG